jgi:hypothetical protein
MDQGYGARKAVDRDAPDQGPAAVDAVEKRAIIAACEAFIRDLPKPRFLPEMKS